MSTWNAVYFRGSVPPDFRPLVVGACPVRRVADWLELSLAGVDDGEPTALALSRLGSGQVIWVVVQTTASVVEVTHYASGAVVRHIGFADGEWRRVEGRPQPWEAWLFSDEEREEALANGDPVDDEELERAFARKTLTAGDQRPWPREWETFFHAIGVEHEQWRAAQAQPPLVTLQGTKTSKLKVFLLAVLVLAGLAAWAALR